MIVGLVSADDPSNGTRHGYNDVCPVFFIQKFMFWSVFFSFSSFAFLFFALTDSLLFSLGFLLLIYIYW